jgi:hypothetical protein
MNILHMKIYTVPKSTLKYRLSSILIHVSDITPFEEDQSLEFRASGKCFEAS